MQVQSSQQPLEKLNTDCLVLAMSEEGMANSMLEKLDRQANGVIQQQCKLLNFSGKFKQTIWLNGIPNIKAKRLLLIGTGKDSLNRFQLNQLIELIANETAKVNGAVAFNLNNMPLLEDTVSWLAGQLVLAVQQKQYHYLSKNTKDRTKILKLIWHGQQQTSPMQQAYAISLGVEYAKRLGDTPANICTPKYLAKQAKSLTKLSTQLSVEVLSEKDMHKLGAGAFVSVAKGSKEAGRLVILKYTGNSKSKQSHMLVGKGVTFDTGGISLKPGQKMDEMKYDMCGAASVLGSMRALLELKPKINVIGILTCAENMPSAHASKPGDVVTSLSGQTIEILNTDAEGRLVLCDALTYGIQQYKPKSVVDIATLTGACMAALGGVNSGLFSADDSMAEQLLDAAHLANDPLWRLPLQEEYQSLLDSNFADIANIGGPLAGATTAACFLSRFTEGTPWAHLDIAGTAWRSGGKDKGATGRPVGLLVNYLLNKQ